MGKSLYVAPNKNAEKIYLSQQTKPDKSFDKEASLNRVRRQLRRDIMKLKNISTNV
jgi:hypothetical protein